mmetsp:Transcript_43084/g.93835  ORF Transcript_43084/g.93835 Transcript_43084/m.93835 type:complete len:257 (-) Transcript_43084:191-961(-)
MMTLNLGDSANLPLRLRYVCYLAGSPSKAGSVRVVNSPMCCGTERSPQTSEATLSLSGSCHSFTSTATTTTRESAYQSGGRDRVLRSCKNLQGCASSETSGSSMPDFQDFSVVQRSEGADSMGQDQPSEAEQAPDEEEVTTIMICDMPCRIWPQDLMDKVDSLGFAGLYDFCHLPSRPSGRTKKRRHFTNLGYAFINFISPEHARAFSWRFANYQFPGTLSEKACTLKAARLQGRAANEEQFGRRINTSKRALRSP